MNKNEYGKIAEKLCDMQKPIYTLKELRLIIQKALDRDFADRAIEARIYGLMRRNLISEGGKKYNKEYGIDGRCKIYIPNYEELDCFTLRYDKTPEELERIQKLNHDYPKNREDYQSINGK